jgi:hypothetical protein
VSVKDCTILAPMASFELCNNRISDFMGPDKLSSFCNYYVEPHISVLCSAFTFGGRMRPMTKTSSREQGLDLELVGTCECLPYLRAFGSQANDVLVRFFPCKVYIDSSRHDTLDYE